MVYRFLLLFCIALLLPLISFSSQEYVVKKGDNLYDLSRKFDVSIEELKEENNLSNNNLKIGNKLFIPNSQEKNIRAANNVYIVKSGDTLSGIAGRHGLSTKDLKKENGLKNSNLQIGQKLGIPSTKKSKDISAQKADNEQSQKSAADSEKAMPVFDSEITVRPKDEPSGEYTVKSGDTLGHIADRYGVTSKTIKELNGLKNDKLAIGQSLKVPVASGTSDAPKPAKVSQKKPLPATYTVKKGDVPGKIAEELGVSTKELIKLNNLNSKSLQIGQKLKVPGAVITEQKTKEPLKQTAKETEKKEALSKATENKSDTKKAESPERTKQSTYTVKKGDTPGEIAEKLGVSTRELISLNSLNSKSLQIGQKLRVPGSENLIKSKETDKVTTSDSSNKKDKTQKTSAAESEVPEVYVVKKGDSLYVISKKYDIPINDIKKKNNLKGSNVRIGQKLTLGSKKSAGTQSLKAQKLTGKYTVKKGDTVSQIAIKFGVSQKELKKDNGLRSNNIRIGQVLKVPGQSETEAKKTAVTKKEPEKKQAYVKKRYVVKSGDTLSRIADNFNVSVKDLKKASALKNDRINKGDVLLIPVPHDYVATPKRSAAKPNYTVVTGDTLGGIASKYGVTVSELKGANGLTDNELWVGMKLKVPAKNSQISSQTTPQATAKIKKDYTVKRGDTLGVIAVRHGVTVKALKQTNKLKSSKIRVGQTLEIPGTAKYMHSYSAESNNHKFDSNGYHSNKKISPKHKIIKVAKKYLGAPYKFGGNSYKTGIDCSGYVKKVFSSFNVNLPRTARDIYYRAGYKIAKSQLDTGDLVFFQTYAKYPSHVGIYIGDNQFIHASSARKRVSIDNMNKRYYRNRYIGAKRIQVSGLFYDEYSKEF